MPFGAGRHYNKGNNKRVGQYPLRKIISESYENGTPYNTLECGHKIQVPQDFVGHTHAEKRRCQQCWKEKQEANAHSE